MTLARSNRPAHYLKLISLSSKDCKLKQLDNQVEPTRQQLDYSDSYLWAKSSPKARDILATKHYAHPSKVSLLDVSRHGRLGIRDRWNCLVATASVGFWGLAGGHSGPSKVSRRREAKDPARRTLGAFRGVVAWPVEEDPCLWAKSDPMASMKPWLSEAFLFT